VAPDVPHTRRSCPDCGGPKYGLAGPEGLRVEEGNQVVIPAGSIRLSLDRNLSTGRFSRPGLAWFVNTMLFEPVPGNLRDASGPEAALDRYRELADEVLQRSSLLAGLDMESASDQEEALRRIGDDRQRRPEWWALLLSLPSIWREKH
jgi:hypothetical protein